MSSGTLIGAVIALLVAVVVVVKVWLTKTWEENLVELLLGFGGLIAILFPYEFSSWQGYRTWSMNQWRFQPEWFVQLSGGVLLGLSAYSVLIHRLGMLH